MLDCTKTCDYLLVCNDLTHIDFDSTANACRFDASLCFLAHSSPCPKKSDFPLVYDRVEARRSHSTPIVNNDKHAHAIHIHHVKQIRKCVLVNFSSFFFFACHLATRTGYAPTMYLQTTIRHKCVLHVSLDMRCQHWNHSNTEPHIVPFWICVHEWRDDRTITWFISLKFSVSYAG